jgi:methylase of polypeptide subunit release factors
MSAARVWTVLELIRWTTDHFASKGIETARLDAECLLAHALETDRLRLYIDYEKPVLEAERAGFRELVRKRGEERIPVAQLTGRREFWSLTLQVTPDVLIPRPETETLIGPCSGSSPMWRRRFPCSIWERARVPSRWRFFRSDPRPKSLPPTFRRRPSLWRRKTPKHSD